MKKALPENWELVKLEDYLDIKGGSQPPKSEFKYKPDDGYIRLLQIRDFGNKPVPTYVKKDDVTKFCEKEDILIARYGASLGRIVTGMEGAYNVALAKVIVENDEFSKRYLFYLLQTQIFQTPLTMISRSAQNGFAKHEISKIELPKPPLPTQHRIVGKIEELFSELDNGVENLKKALQQLKTYRQAVLKDAFEGKLTKEWRALRQAQDADDLLTPEEILEQIKAERKAHRERELDEWEKEVEQWEKDGKPGRKPRKPSKPKKLSQITEEDLSSIPDIPSSWRYTYLYDLGDLGRGKSKHRPRNDEKLFKDGTIPFIQTGEVKAAQKHLRSFEKTYNEFGLSQSKLWPKGTLCITIAANIAETAILEIDACFPDSIVGYTSYDSISDKLFVFYFIQSVQKRLEAFAPATAQKNINLTTLENLLVPLCSIKEQKEIVNEIESRLSVVDQLEQTIKENLQKAEALRQSILKKAFGGELVKEEIK